MNGATGMISKESDQPSDYEDYGDNVKGISHKIACLIINYATIKVSVFDFYLLYNSGEKLHDLRSGQQLERK